jgi:arsenate reductase
MILYVYGKCSTCKDALFFLKKHGIAFTQKEITKETPSISELQQMLSYQNGSLKKLFNTSGLLYKELQLRGKFDELTVDAALFLLNQHGMLIKRPFLLGDDFGLLGFKEADWSKNFY